MRRPIAISLSPNLENQDVFLAIRSLLMFWLWKNGGSIKMLEQWFRQYFKVGTAVSFSSGRGALFALLKSMDIEEGDEVILQAFTCAAVVNAVIWAGARPVFVDIKGDFTIDPLDIKKKMSKKTKVIIVQHTFGIPAEIHEIQKIAREHKTRIIEDCAHVIGPELKGRKIGRFGDAAIFSFGRDKAFSSVFGGMVITADEVLGTKIRSYQKIQDYPQVSWILQQVFHPIAFYFILPLYDFFSFGKILLRILQKIHILTFPVTTGEKIADPKELSVKKMPNILCSLALSQLRRLSRFNGRREFLAKQYITGFAKFESINMPSKNNLPYLRFPILVSDQMQFFTYLRRKKIYAGLWYTNIIDPKGVSLEKMRYERGSCPNAERLVGQVVNLPCYPTMSDNDIKLVINAVSSYVRS